MKQELNKKDVIWLFKDYPRFKTSKYLRSFYGDFLGYHPLGETYFWDWDKKVIYYFAKFDTFRKVSFWLKTGRTTAKDLNLRNCFFYSKGDFIENLEKIQSLVFSAQYELISIQGLNFVRRSK